MAITFVGGSTGTWAGATSGNNTVSLTALTGGSNAAAAAGDLVIAIYATGSAADRALTITDGTNNYTLIASELYANGTSYDTNLRVAYKMLTAADTSVTFGPTGNAQDAGAAIVYVWRGVSGVVHDVTATSATGTATGRPNPAAITPVTAGSVIICAGGAAAATGATFTFSDLSNTKTATSADTNDATVGVGSYAWTSGAFDGVAWTGGTANAADSWASVTIALRPAQGVVEVPDSGSASFSGATPSISLSVVVSSPVGSVVTTGSVPTPVNELPFLPVGVGSAALAGTTPNVRINTILPPTQVIASVLVDAVSASVINETPLSSSPNALTVNVAAVDVVATSVVNETPVASTPDALTVGAASVSAFICTGVGIVTPAGSAQLIGSVLTHTGPKAYNASTGLLSTSSTAPTVSIFTPGVDYFLPVAAGAVSVSASDPYWSNVTVAMHFNGMNGSTSFIDETGRTWTLASGSASISTASYKFGGASGLFGYQNNLTATLDAGFHLGGVNFTIEAFVNPTSLNGCIISSSYSGGGGQANEWAFSVDSSGYLNFQYNDGTFSGNYSISATSNPISASSGFHHVAITYDGATARFFVDGVLSGTGTIPTINNSGGYGQANIGNYYNDNRRYKGYIDDLRVTKGVARYTATFTAPSSEFTTSGPVPSLAQATLYPTGTGSIAVTGQAPSLAIVQSLAASPAAASATLTGQTPSAALGLFTQPENATPSLTGYAPTVSTSAIISAATGALSLTGQTTSPFEQSYRLSAAATATITGLAPSLTTSVVNLPAAATLTAAGQTPTAALGINLVPATGSVGATGQAVITSQNIAVQTTTGALTGTGVAPTIPQANNYYPVAGALVAVGQVPTIPQTNLQQPAAATVTAAGQVPTTKLSFVASPSTAALSAAGQAPTVVSGTGVVSVNNGALSLTPTTPTLQFNYRVSPAVGALTVAGQTVAAGSTTFTPICAASLTGYAPTPVTNALFYPATANATLTGSAPTPVSDARFYPAQATATLAGLSLTIPQSNNYYPGATSSTFSGQTPTLNCSYTIAVDAGGLTLTGYSAGSGGTFTLAPGVGTLNLAGQTPALFREYLSAPGTSTAAFSGQVPTTKLGFNIAVAVGSLELTGYAPDQANDITVTTPDGALIVDGGVPMVGIPHDIDVPTAELLLASEPFIADFTRMSSVDVGALVVSSDAPSLLITFECSVDSGTLTATGCDVTPSTDIPIIIDTGTLSYDGVSSPLVISEAVSVYAGDCGALSSAGQAPVAALNIKRIPNTGGSAFSGKAPALQVGVAATPDVGYLASAGSAPNLSEMKSVQVTVGAPTLSGFSPSLAYGFGLTPSAGGVVSGGWVPSLRYTLASAPASGTPTFSGQAPIVQLGIKLTTPIGVLAGVAQPPVPSLGVVGLPGSGEVVAQGVPPTPVFYRVIDVGCGAVNLLGKKTAAVPVDNAALVSGSWVTNVDTSAWARSVKHYTWTRVEVNAIVVRTARKDMVTQ